MAPINYSKWDNIDTDSEPEVKPLSIPAPQAPAPTAPRSSAAATAPVTSSTPGSIQAVIADHPVLNFVPPVPRLTEVPLVFHRVGTQSANPPYVGTVLVARKDKKPLLPQHLEGVWMYCDYIQDLFGEGEGAPTHLYNRQAFEGWWKEYCDEQKEFRPDNGGDNDPDDWRAVRSPYEM
ncbi:hypothetical protein F5883DRAFT_609553 [Diaporthe sp. PMI_573]|nr:hypothetical protein F5883DRAFT_609553 [Diaporthaceae sp. PMI_573]